MLNPDDYKTCHISREIIAKCSDINCGDEKGLRPKFLTQNSYNKDGRHVEIDGLCPRCGKWHRVYYGVEYAKKPDGE